MRVQPHNRSSNRRWLPRLVCGVAKLSLLLLTTDGLAAPAEKPSPDASAPAVTRKEADILKQALDAATVSVAEAIAVLKKQNLPDASAALDFALGNLYFQNGDLTLAESAYQAALQKLPFFRGALTNLGRVYLLQNKTAETVALYQTVVRDGRPDADILLLLGHALLLSDYPLAAENAYRQALLFKPDASDIKLGLVKCLLQQDRLKESSALLAELLKQEPAKQELWTLKANLALAQDKPDEAILAIECARRLHLATPDMLATLGDLYLNRQQPEDAIACYRRAFAVESPSMPRMLRAAEGFLMLGETEQAAALLDQADQWQRKSPHLFAPDQRRTLLRLAGDLARLRDCLDDAMAAYQKLLAEDPLDGKTLLLLGDLQYHAGQMEEALMTFERAARVPGYEARGLVRQAQLEVERERYARAVELLESALVFDNRPNVARFLEQIRRIEK